MDFLNISRKYRPKTFKEVVGQPISCKLLSNSILLNRIPSAVLLSGIRGTGKTTLARIFAKALNCENFSGEVCGICKSCVEADNGSHPDILEFDAASNNGVDFVRELESVFHQVENFKRRAIIFDEAHMFTTQAQNALLKTLEEPPSNLTFILSTTEPERLETTFRSRCLSMPLRPLTSMDIAANLRYVLSCEGKAASDDFIDTLALQGGGSLRDVQQLLDQLILASGDAQLDAALLEEAIGCVSTAQYKQLAAVLCSQDLKLSLEQLELWGASGMDLELLFIEGVPNLLRDFAMVEAGVAGVQLLSGILPSVIKSRLTFDRKYIKVISAQWERTLSTMRHTSRPKVVWAMFFISIFSPDPTRS